MCSSSKYLILTVYRDLPICTNINWIEFEFWPNFYHIKYHIFCQSFQSFEKSMTIETYNQKIQSIINSSNELDLSQHWCGLQVLPCHMAKQVTSLSCPKHASSAEAWGHFLRKKLPRWISTCLCFMREVGFGQILEANLFIFYWCLWEGNRDLLILCWLYLALLIRQRISTPLAAEKEECQTNTSQSKIKTKIIWTNFYSSCWHCSGVHTQKVMR